MADIPDVSSDLNALNAAWMQGETVAMRYDWQDGDPGYAAEANAEEDIARGRLTTLTNLGSTLNVPQAELVQVGQRHFAHGVRREEIRPNFNATIGLMKWIRQRNTRVNRRLPVGVFSFETADNAAPEVVKRYAFKGFIRDRVLDGPVATEAVPVTVQPVIQLVEDTEPVYVGALADAAQGVAHEPDMPTLATVEDKWIQGETVELLFDDKGAGDPDADADDRLATLTRISMSKSHPQQELAQIGSRRFAHGPPLSVVSPRLNTTAALLEEVRSRMVRTNRLLPRRKYGFKCTDNAGDSLTAPFTGVIRDRDLDFPVTADGAPTEIGLTIQVTDFGEQEYT